MSSTSLVPAGHDTLAQLVTLVTDSVTSPHSKAAYGKALRDFMTWWHEVNPDNAGLSKAAVQRFVTHMGSQGLSASTINLRLAAVRKLVVEGADNGLIDAAVAQAICRVKGPKRAGVRSGNWLTAEQAERLLAAPDATTLKGVRDRAILAVMIGGGLRRSEVSELTFDHVQQREGRWAIMDMTGKGNRIRNVQLPSWAKVAIDRWSAAAGIDSGKIFRPLNNKGLFTTRDSLLPQNIMELVAKYGAEIGVPHLAPHDLRRTFAKLAHRGKAALEQIQQTLGHASVVTTERYLGTKQDMQDAPCDHLNLRVG